MKKTPLAARWQLASALFVFALYFHNLNPDVVRFSPSIAVHWYGVAYVVGFLAAAWLMARLARRGIGELKEKEVVDFITYGAIFGVMLGGRLGYLLLYNFDAFIKDPKMFIYFWDGGMSAHGGIIGLFLYTLYYALRHKRSWPGVGDNLVCVSPLGILFGRIANFVNGELYGRQVDPKFPLAVQFPKELLEEPRLASEAMAALGDKLPEGATAETIVQMARNSAEVREKLGTILTPRHPSQLYEAALEGLALFLILWTVRVLLPRAPHGLLTGLFFLFYAAFRILCERMWRVGDGSVGMFSRGEFYSLFMIGGGAAFVIYACFIGKRTESHA